MIWACRSRRRLIAKDHFGVYRYEKESKSEFRNWCEDMPAECAGDLLDAEEAEPGKVRRARNGFIRPCALSDWVSWLTDK